LRHFIEFSYKGTQYHGWQVQPNAVSVQEVLNKALSVLLNQTIETVGAGRTDSGVHARQMFAHFDCATTIDPEILTYKLNSYLPKDIAVHNVVSVHDEAHARFDATARTYEYIINTTKDPFRTDSSWYFSQPLNIDLMNQASKVLLNHQDFECFSKSNTDVHTFNCRIIEAYWTQKKSSVLFTISADRFLRNMVRAIVGTIINVGLQKITVSDFNNIVLSKNRSNAGASVPAHGLYLTQIKYDYINSAANQKIAVT
jgi:tRNA pseudouridine38-40 synthase